MGDRIEESFRKRRVKTMFDVINLSAEKSVVKIVLQGCVLSISKRLATPPPAA